RIGAGARIEGGDEDNPYVITGEETSVTFGSGTVEGGRIEIGPSGSREAGRLSFSATMSGETVSPSLRYFYRTQSGSLAGFEYPVFSSESELASPDDSILVEASIHPNHPADAGLNRFVIKSTASTKSNFVSVNGDAL